MAHDPEHYKAGIRSRLAGLANLRAKAEKADTAIAAAARKRLAVVEAEIEKAKPMTGLEDGAAERYQSLVLERGRLNRVLAS